MIELTTSAGSHWVNPWNVTGVVPYGEGALVFTVEDAQWVTTETAEEVVGKISEALRRGR